jgi:hypothetical protein
MRDKHTFQFTGAEIARGARAERDYHRDRAAWWEAEQVLAVAAARKSAVEVREYAHTGGTHCQIVVDHTLDTRLRECGMKIGEHRRAVDEFDILARQYASNPDRSYELDPGDVAYFRLAGAPRPS